MAVRALVGRSGGVRRPAAAPSPSVVAYDRLAPSSRAFSSPATAGAPDGPSRPELHPLLKEVEPCPTIDPGLRVLTFLSAHAAQGDVAGCVQDWRYVMQTHRQAAMEAVLQTHLFAGFPRAINAVAGIAQYEDTLAGAAGAGGQAKGWDGGPPEAPGDWHALGDASCGAIYAPKYDRLRRHMKRLSPSLDLWMLEHGYGRVLSRPGLGLRERELCVLAILAGQNVAPQLTAHVRGAMAVGAGGEEVRAVLQQTGLLWGAAAQEQVDAVWATFERARYDL